MTYWRPGHQSRIGPVPDPSLALTVQSQVTFFAPARRNTVTTCRHAATHADGDVWVYPQLYQLPSGSLAKPMITGCPKDRTSSANDLRLVSARPAATSFIGTRPGLSWTSATAPFANACSAKDT